MTRFRATHGLRLLPLEVTQHLHFCHKTWGHDPLQFFSFTLYVEATQASVINIHESPQAAPSWLTQRSVFPLQAVSDPKCPKCYGQALARTHVAREFRTFSCVFVHLVSGVVSCNLVQSRVFSCDLVRSRAISCDLVRSQNVSCNLKMSRAISCAFARVFVQKTTAALP